MVFLILLLEELAVIEESMISTFYNSIGKYSIEYDIPILNVMVVLAGQPPPLPSPPQPAAGCAGKCLGKGELCLPGGGRSEAV